MIHLLFYCKNRRNYRKEIAKANSKCVLMKTFLFIKMERFVLDLFKESLVVAIKFYCCDTSYGRDDKFLLWALLIPFPFRSFFFGL